VVGFTFLAMSVVDPDVGFRYGRYDLDIISGRHMIEYLILVGRYLEQVTKSSRF
jgi:hypothetical protein